MPDSPIALSIDYTNTNTQVIQFTWIEGLSNGGSPVIDYQIWYDQSIGNIVSLATGVTTLSYTTNFTLTPGATYSFYVQARNLVGYSQFSVVLQVLAASVPS